LLKTVLALVFFFDWDFCGVAVLLPSLSIICCWKQASWGGLGSSHLLWRVCEITNHTHTKLPNWAGYLLQYRSVFLLHLQSRKRIHHMKCVCVYSKSFVTLLKISMFTVYFHIHLIVYSSLCQSYILLYCSLKSKLILINYNFHPSKSSIALVRALSAIAWCAPPSSAIRCSHFFYKNRMENLLTLECLDSLDWLS
jgi:hypothetical protein